jgi:hypothetical protein
MRERERKRDKERDAEERASWRPAENNNEGKGRKKRRIA